MYQIQVMYEGGWRKLRDSANFLQAESAIAYGRKYLMKSWFRVIEISTGNVVYS